MFIPFMQFSDLGVYRDASRFCPFYPYPFPVLSLGLVYHFLSHANYSLGFFYFYFVYSKPLSTDQVAIGGII